MDYEKCEKERSAYFEKRKAEIKIAVECEKRRLYKANQKTEKIFRKFSGQQSNRKEQLRRRLEAIDTKCCNIKTKISNLKSLYEDTALMQYGVPLNFIGNSLTYSKNGEHHVLLGYFANGIGIEHHGHMIITANGKLRYVRFPGEAHGYLYHINPPITPFEFFNNEYVNHKRTVAFQKAEIAKSGTKIKLACSGA